MTKIYFASPLFSEMELSYNEQVASMIEDRFSPFYSDFSLYLPQRNMGINDKEAYADSRDIAKADTEELLSSDILVAVLDGSTIDVGVATEIGVAYQAGMPIVGLYTDSRQSGGTNTKKLNALQDLAESQFSYVNLYTVGLIKLNGRVVSTVDGMLRELDFLVHETEELKSQDVSNENINNFFKDLNKFRLEPPVAPIPKPTEPTKWEKASEDALEDARKAWETANKIIKHGEITLVDLFGSGESDE